ncbi:unnamed protein product [Phytophthora fragariaefolia]|uniref:Unnamed protein product n=1 Tax=Phytophthora fragariaefolia TaxID=1490495 RepID=A0A9W6XFN5_9STRA|nr:unnamed protein product [Phytophthora fragariaefolia]
MQENYTADFNHDGWLEKVFERQKAVKPTEPKKYRRNFIQRAFKSLTPHHSKSDVPTKKDLVDEFSYKDELHEYIAESSANLRYGYAEEEPLNTSDEDTSDEDSSPRNAELSHSGPPGWCACGWPPCAFHQLGIQA